MKCYLMGYAKLCHHPARPTIIHHHPPPAKIYPPPPTTNQNISTTTYHFSKNGPPSRKNQNLFIYITSFWDCFNNIFFFEMQYSFPWRRFCVIKFWSVRFSNSKLLLHSVHFTIFKIFWSWYFTSLRLQDLYCLFL